MVSSFALIDCVIMQPTRIASHIFIPPSQPETRRRVRGRVGRVTFARSREENSWKIVCTLVHITPAYPRLRGESYHQSNCKSSESLIILCNHHSIKPSFVLLGWGSIVARNMQTKLHSETRSSNAIVERDSQFREHMQTSHTSAQKHNYIDGLVTALAFPYWLGEFIGFFDNRM